MLTTATLGPKFDQYSADCVVILGSEELRRRWEKLGGQSKRCILWNEVVSPETVRRVRIFSDDMQDQLPALLQLPELTLSALNIQSKFLSMVSAAPCFQTLDEYLEVDGDGKAASIETAKLSKLKALWVGGVRTPIKLVPSALVQLESAQLCFGRSTEYGKSIATLLPRLTTAGLWGISKSDFQYFNLTSDNVTYLRILSSNINSCEFVSRFQNLKIVHFQSCPNLKDISALSEVKGLQTAAFWWCPHIKKSQELFSSAAFSVEYFGTSNK